MTRPGRYGEDPEANRPRVKLWEWTPFKVYTLLGLILMGSWWLSTR